MSPSPLDNLRLRRAYDLISDKLGKVEETVGDSTLDIFDGITVSTGLLSKPRYVPAELVGEIVEGRVALTIDKDRFEALDEYQEPPATEQVEP